MLFKTTALAVFLAALTPPALADDAVFGTWCPTAGGENITIARGIRANEMIIRGDTLACAGSAKITSINPNTRLTTRDVDSICAVKLASFSSALVEPSATGLHFAAEMWLRHVADDKNGRESLQIWLDADDGGREFTSTFEPCSIPTPVRPKPPVHF